MSKNAKNLVLEGVCVPSHTVHRKNEIAAGCKKNKSKPLTVVGTV